MSLLARLELPANNLHPVDMDYLQVITLAIASVAVILSLWQFFTRHMPFVGISKGVLNYDNTTGYSVDLTLRNWGDIQANTIRIILESEDFSRQPYSPNRTLNVLFPNQETLVVWGAAISEKARSSFEIESVIQVDLK